MRLEVTDKQFDMSIDNIVITTLREKEKELEVQLSELRTFINSLANKDNSHVQFKRQTLPPPVEKRKYNTTGRRKRSQGEAIDPIADKMKSAHRFLHRVEIAELTGLDPLKISSTLSIAARNHKHGLVNYVPGTSKNQTVWGFKDWLAADGKPRAEYMFNEAFVLARR